MEQKFGKNSIDIEALREFCEREGKEVTYRKGDQLEREGDPARWFGFVTEGYFKYVTYGISDDKAPIKREPSSSLGMAEREEARPKVKEHITWFSFEGEFCWRLSRLPRRSSIADHDRGNDAQPLAPCERRTADGLFSSRR